MTSVAVCGNGFVGGSLTTVLTERGVTVYAYDKAGVYKPGASECVPETQAEAEAKFPCITSSAKIVPGLRFPRSIEELVVNAEKQPGFSGIFFVCLPTPMNLEDGSCDTSIVEGVLDELASVPGGRIAVIKSTVPPGSTERWNERFNGRGLFIVHSPEFLREASALDDQRNQKFIILGGPRPHINKVRDLFRIAFPTVPIHKTSSSNSEMMKYFINTFLATKVSFANEFLQICEGLAGKQGLDVDYDRIVELATLDERIGTSHLKVPGPMPADDGTGRLLRGYAGSCFVKDINSLVNIARSVDVDPKVLESAWKKNEEVRPEKDWLRLLGRAVSKKS